MVERQIRMFIAINTSNLEHFINTPKTTWQLMQSQLDIMRAHRLVDF